MGMADSGMTPKQLMEAHRERQEQMERDRQRDEQARRQHKER